MGTTFPLQRKGERTRDTKFIQISLFVKGVSVELVVQHTTTKNIIYLTAPRWWLVHGRTRAPPPWVPWVALYRAERVGSSQSAVSGERERTDR